MSEVVAIDTETFYAKDIDIKTLGYHHYLRHPQSDIYMLSVASATGTWVGHPKNFNWDSLQGTHVISHNRGFDAAVEQRLVEIGVKPKHVSYAEENCTADLVAYLACHRDLKKSAEALLGKAVSKDVRDKAKGKRFADMPPETQEEMRKYALGDAITCLELWQGHSYKWPASERRVSQINRQSMQHGVFVDKEGLKQDAFKMADVMKEASKGIPWYNTTPPLSPQALEKYCAEQGIPAPESTAEDSPEFEQWSSQFGEKYPVVNSLRRWRKANTLYKKLCTVYNRIRDDGTYSVELKYFGAGQTGRFSGGGGANIQNLGRKPHEGVDLRKRFIARPGKTLVMCDLSQIESRVIQFLSGNTEMTETLRAGYNIYEAFAKTNNLLEFEKGKLKKIHPDIYAMCKATILGAGFGMSGEKFAVAAPILTNGDYRPNIEEAKRVITKFRRDNPRIVALWKNLEKGFKASVGEDFIVRLPSGRELNYFQVSGLDWSFNKFQGSVKPMRNKAWSGRLAENLVQATARDILADMMIRTVNAGLQILFTVHDEIVIEVDKADAEDAKKKLLEIMTTPPEWIKGIVLGAEAEISDFYKK